MKLFSVLENINTLTQKMTVKKKTGNQLVMPSASSPP